MIMIVWTVMSELEYVHDDYSAVAEVRNGVPAIDLPFDFTKTDRRWEDKYGITSVPLLVRAANGTLYDDKRLKGIFVNGLYKRIVSRKYVVFPNGEVHEIVVEICEREGLTLKQPVQDSHYGDAMYWMVLDESRETQVAKDDSLNLGCIVRNSLGAGVALGADLFTYRLVCSNGAIARGKDMGSVALRHMGTHDEMLLTFKDAINNVYTDSHDLVGAYRKATGIRMNLKIAKEFVKWIPERALPTSIEIERRKGKIVSTRLTRRDTLWEAFNEVTKGLWHHNKSRFTTKMGLLQKAHWVLLHATSSGQAAAVAAS
jgi:Domain of unknown function (DUF932)